MKDGEKSMVCAVIGRVTVTTNTPVKSGSIFSGEARVVSCDHCEKCGVGLPYSKQKCDDIREGIIRI